MYIQRSGVISAEPVQDVYFQKAELLRWKKCRITEIRQPFQRNSDVLLLH